MTAMYHAVSRTRIDTTDHRITAPPLVPRIRPRGSSESAVGRCRCRLSCGIVASAHRSRCRWAWRGGALARHHVPAFRAIRDGPGDATDIRVARTLARSDPAG